MAKELLGLAVLNVLLLVAGSGVLVSVRWCSPAAVHRFRGIAYVTGVAYAGVAGLLLLALGLAFTRIEFLLAVLAPWAVWAVRDRVQGGSAPRIPTPRYTWFGLSAIAVAAVTVVRSAWQPLTAWDAWAFWTPKAESIVYFGGLSKTFFHSGIANPDYPPLIPALESLAFRFMGSFDTTLVHVQFSLLLFGFVVALTELVGMRPAPRTGSIFIILIATAPTLILQTVDAYADVPIAIFASLGAVMLWSATFERVAGARVLAAVFLAAVLATKIEGMLFAAAMLIVLLVLARDNRRSQLHVVVIGIASVLVSVLPWRLWLAVNDVHSTGRLSAADFVDRTARSWDALGSILVNSLSPRDWLLLPLMCLIAGAYGLTSRQSRQITLFMVGTTLLTWFGLVVVYWGTTYSFDWYMRTTVNRVITTPVLVLAALAAWELSEGSRTESVFSPFERTEQVVPQ